MAADRLPLVPPEPTPLLTVAEAEAVRAAVARAEAASGAEIVPVVVASTDGHEVAGWKGAALGALAGALVAAAGAWLRPAWGPVAAELVLPAVAGALAGALVARLPGPRRLLVGAELLDARTASAAHEAFVRLEVFRTRERTGLLIFVALFEHRVRILADEGIHPSVPPEEWGALARAVANDLRVQTPGAALLAAVTRAGGLLAARGPNRRPDDANELSDTPVQSAPPRAD